MQKRAEKWVLPPPNSFGAPDKFDSWWPGQDQATLRVVDSVKRFTGLCLPTGAGKTVIYIVAALLEGARICVLTTTKPLQDQLLDDFHSIGLIDIRGQGNYPCKELQPGGRYWKSSQSEPWRQRCDRGPCHTGAQCDLKASGCHSFDALRRARTAKFLVTNYSFWMSNHKYSEGLGDFDMLVLDEAHHASASLAGFLHVDLYSSEVEGLLGTAFPSFETQEEWSQWAAVQWAKSTRLVEELLISQKDHYDSSRAAEIKELKEIVSKTEAISNMKGEWVIERPEKGKKKMTFDPVWSAAYAESNLFLGIDKILLVSATIREESCRQLGIPKDDLEFLEQPSTFPVERRPFIHIPTIRVNHRSTQAELEMWVTRIDQIIDRRLDRKGIIHTVSFKRRNFLMKHTRHRDIMLTNVTENTRQVVEKFKKAKAPTVLVSPSLTTGFDFPAEECRYQIIGKIPFPDHRSKVLQARCKDNKDYSSFLAMQTLVQSYGRGMRAADDFCEVLIVDDNIKWFMFKHGKAFAPKWFREAYKSVAVVPSPQMPVLFPEKKGV